MIRIGLRWPPWQEPDERVAAFVDGFNVYHGLHDKGFQRFYWLDYRALVETFVRPGQALVAVKYFTARVKKPAESKKRQSTYLDALDAHGGLEIIEGKYVHRSVKCRECSATRDRPNEKMTDVNVATHLVAGAIRDEYDTAILICADADLVPAVRVAQGEGKRIIVVSPRGRTSADLVAESDSHLHFSTSALGKCQLPDLVPGQGGIELRRPDTWT
ncbi:MAG TPA: NYN domain-containing protein [Acidimicrobiia bacterium]|nr:NYN domain-containing protein [Acidimicrobiia bacterium]